MAINAVTEGSSLEQYTVAVRSIGGDGKDPQLPYRVKGQLEKLLTSTSQEEPWMAQLIQDAHPGRELYRDPDHGFIQMGHGHLKIRYEYPSRSRALLGPLRRLPGGN
jgi:hypothetical protein